jgi:hypothetical protein
MRRLVSLIAFALLLLNTSPALAEEQVASSGPVTAKLSFELEEEYGPSEFRLTIERHGQVVFDGTVGPCGSSCSLGASDGDSVAVRELNGDGEPEVIVSLYTRGAHCCFFAVIAAFDGTGYRVHERYFGNPPFRLRDLDGDGAAEFISHDDRFAYRYTSYASSVLPVMILGWNGRRMVDKTRKFKRRVRSDLRRTWRLFKTANRAGYEPRGAAAAWAANRYRLGKRRSTLRTLRRLARAGRLKGYPPRDPLRFVSSLDRFLVRAGYARR